MIISRSALVGFLGSLAFGSLPSLSIEAIRSNLALLLSRLLPSIVRSDGLVGTLPPGSLLPTRTTGIPLRAARLRALDCEREPVAYGELPSSTKPCNFGLS